MATHLTIIAGLGNPEERYERTLHNAGFWFVDELARRDIDLRVTRGLLENTDPLALGEMEAWLERFR